MTAVKTLAQLGEEYEYQAQLLSEQIKRKNKKLASLADPRCSKQAYIIKSDLSILYRQRREALETARKLKNYYDTELTGICEKEAIAA